ncbi:MAG: SurA N-terminal domain-containing protein [Clostridia bacterium]|nr:SurA N-terminal domain-containing protein [Clostridia bacterium]
MRSQSLVKLLALLLILLFSVTAFTGCSNAAMEIGDQEVSYDLLRYFTMNYRNDLGYTAEEYAADPTKGEELQSLVHEQLREVMAYRALMEEFDLELTDEEKESVQTSLEELKANYADTASYEEALAEAYLTEAVYKELLEMQLYAQKVYDHLTSARHNLIPSDDATVDADIAAGNFFSAEYLYIYYVESDKDEKVAFADTLYKELQAGASMRELDDRYATEYGLSMEYVELGAFTYTQQAEEFEELILSLEEGECAAPVVRGDGILIARRRALSMDFVNENYSDIVQSYKEREFAYYIRDYGEKMKIAYQGDYKDLVLWEME